MAKDYKQLAKEIVRLSGGVSNISSVSHCMTRLRLRLHNTQDFDNSAISGLPGVLSVVVQNGEHQVVVGQDVPNLYAEVQKIEGIANGGYVEDAETAREDIAIDNKAKGFKAWLNLTMSFIGGTFSPVIPVLVAGGLTGAVLTLLTNFFDVSSESGTYVVIHAINQAAFYSLPVFIGFSAATRLKSNGYLGAFLASILLFSTLNGVEGLNFLGANVPKITYNGTVFPIILGVLFMSVVYKYLEKMIPVYLKTIFVPLLTMLLTVPVTLLILGPIGNILGTWLADGVFALYKAAPAPAVMIIGMTTPLMVFFGMNNATYPVLFALIAEIGSDPLIMTGMAPANVAVGGAALAVMLISKDVNQKSISMSAGITALCGITEPAVYGILFPQKYPLIGAMVGGAIGGLLAGLLNMTQYVVSTPGFISLPAYIDPSGDGKNLIVSIIVMTIALVSSFVCTYVLGKKGGKIS